MSSVSTVKILEDGYIKELGVSDKSDLLTDTFGKFLASLFATYSAAPSFTVNNSNGDPILSRAVAWGTVSGRFGLWGHDTSNTGEWMANLGIGLTTVTRSDFGIETPIVGAGGDIKLITNSFSGYSDAKVINTMTTVPFTTAQSVAEGAVYGRGHQASSDTINNYCFMRYNYTPLPVAIGEAPIMENTLNI
jgi:hypothetical protein